MDNSEKSFQKFLLLWTGNFVSSIGSGLSSFGLGVYVFQQTGKVSFMALVTLLAFLPSLLLSVPAGVLADRYDRRLLMILGDSLSAIGLVFILLCMMGGEASMWQICFGVTVSSVFASLLEPAYKATATDLLSEDQYSKASGLVQIAGSAKYLISPVLAGYLLKVSDIRLLLLIDICTFFVTVTATFVVRSGLKNKKTAQAVDFLSDIKEGFDALTEKSGVITLVIMGAVVTFCLGMIQTLVSPMILSFTDSPALGILTSVTALGMLVSSLILGIVPIKGGYTRLLCVSLFGAGVFMVLFGLRENLILIGISGFLFFSMLPFTNTGIDVLLRTNLDNQIQGRAWGLIGLISQLGYVVAYAISGLLADYVFTPGLMPGGALATTVGKVTGIGAGRGIGLLISLSGLLLCLTALLLYVTKSIRELELGGLYDL